MEKILEIYNYPRAYVSGDYIVEHYGERLGIKKTQVYELINRGVFVSGKVKTRTVVWEQSVIDYLEMTLEERRDYVAAMGVKDHWRMDGHKLVGKFGTTGAISTVLGLSKRTVVKYLDDMSGYVKVEGKRNRRGKIDPLSVTGMIKDINE